MPNLKQGVLGRTSPGMGISQLGSQGRADAARAIDSMKASLEKGFVGLDKHLPTDLLISEAGDIVSKLMNGSIPGTLERGAAAMRFLKMRDVLEERLALAPRDENFLPKLEGVKWKTNDPLAGIVEGISPFHMADWITMFMTDVQKSQPRPHFKRPKPTGSGPNVSGGVPAAQPVQKDPWAKSTVPSSKGIGEGLKEPSENKVPGAVIDILSKELLKALELEMLGLMKTAYGLLTKWIDALREGVNKSTRRAAMRFLPEIIANVATGIKGAPKVIERTVGGGTFKVKGTEIDWSGMTIPAPSLRADARQQIWDMNFKQWHQPSDHIAFAEGEKMAVAKVQAFLSGLNEKRQNGARKYLWLLRLKYNANYNAISEHVASELRREME